jgi:hypothetical protein
MMPGKRHNTAEWGRLRQGWEGGKKRPRPAGERRTNAAVPRDFTPSRASEEAN